MNLCFLITIQDLEVKEKEHSNVFNHEMHLDLLPVYNLIILEWRHEYKI